MFRFNRKLSIYFPGEIAKPEVFRVCPLSERGTFTAIAELFQGPENLNKSVDELQLTTTDYMERL